LLQELGQLDSEDQQLEAPRHLCCRFSRRAFPLKLRSGQTWVRCSTSTARSDLRVDRSHKLTLTAPEMTVLVGGMRVLNTNTGQSKHGVFTDRPETLTPDFFVNLLAMSTEWKASSASEDVFEGRDRQTGEVKWTGTRVDLVFCSNSLLRAIAEVYASDDSQQAFVRDFLAP